MSKLSNCLTMLEILSSGKKYSIKELSEKLEVSERMIRVYKDDLDKCGIFIDTLMGPYGGYVLKKSNIYPKRKFNGDDLDILNELKKYTTDSRINLLIDKIKGYYYESQNEKLELDEDIKSYYNLLNRSIKNHNKVKINYYSYTHGDEDRIIHPLEMFYFNNGWGCAAFCEKKQDLRHFELKRINRIEILDEKF